jgi:hypothetical protein
MSFLIQGTKEKEIGSGIFTFAGIMVKKAAKSSKKKSVSPGKKSVATKKSAATKNKPAVAAKSKPAKKSASEKSAPAEKQKQVKFSLDSIYANPLKQAAKASARNRMK